MWHKPLLMNWISSLLFGLAVLTLMYTAVFVVVHLPIFPIQRVKLVRPLQHVTQEQVEFVLKNEMRGNFFTVNLGQMVDSFEKLPWAQSVSLRRRWPNILEITLEEHQPLARWGDTALLNTNGVKFSAASSLDLPVFNGESGMEEEMIDGYRRFSAMLTSTGHELVELNLTDRRAWTLKLDNGLVMELGREDVDERLGHFVDVFDRTLSTLPNLAYVDLRYPNGFTVRMSPSEAPVGMNMNKKSVVASTKAVVKPATAVRPKPAVPTASAAIAKPATL